nr:hypothetical protein CFP56_58681 [Quercus suber]
MRTRLSSVQPPEEYTGSCQRVELSDIGEHDEVMEGDWGMYMDCSRSSRCTSDDAAQPSHLAGHDDSVEHISYAQAGPRSPPPSRLSPPLFSDSAHDGGCIFVPIPG